MHGWLDRWMTCYRDLPHRVFVSPPPTRTVLDIGSERDGDCFKTCFACWTSSLPFPLLVLMVRFDVIFPRIACGFLSIDTEDHTGIPQAGASSDITRVRLDLEGRPVGE